MGQRLSTTQCQTSWIQACSNSSPDYNSSCQLSDLGFFSTKCNYFTLNHKITEVERDLRRSSRPTSCYKMGQLEIQTGLFNTLSSQALKMSVDGDWKHFCSNVYLCSVIIFFPIYSVVPSLLKFMTTGFHSPTAHINKEPVFSVTSIGTRRLLLGPPKPFLCQIEQAQFPSAYPHSELLYPRLLCSEGPNQNALSCCWRETITSLIPVATFLLSRVSSHQCKGTLLADARQPALHDSPGPFQQSIATTTL